MVDKDRISLSLAPFRVYYETMGAYQCEGELNGLRRQLARLEYEAELIRALIPLVEAASQKDKKDKRKT